MNNILEVNNLVKNYGKKSVLNQTTFTIAPRRIVGLMGPNGSGKTTMLKIFSGLIKSKSGEVEIKGRKLGQETKALVSFMPDESILYKWMKVKDAIDFYKGFYPDFDSQRMANLLNFMELTENQKVDKLSKGNSEKLMIALTISRSANLYLLDEPLGGIDPVAKSKILSSILEHFTREDSSMLISTHLIKDVEKVFDDVLFLKDGKIHLAGECDQLREEHGKTIEDLYIDIFSSTASNL